MDTANLTTFSHSVVKISMWLEIGKRQLCVYTSRASVSLNTTSQDSVFILNSLWTAVRNCNKIDTIRACREGSGNPLQCSCQENARDGRAWWAAISGVAQNQTRVKWLSSSSSMHVCMLSHFSHVPLFVTRGLPARLSIHRIIQVRILEWAAMPSSSDSSQGLSLPLLCLLHWQRASLPLKIVTVSQSFSASVLLTYWTR